MKVVEILRRPSTEKQTLGVLIAPKGENELFVCKTLELPWHQNLSNISCIPEDEYLCTYTLSSALSLMAGHDVFTYQIANVPNRSGIRIHSANHFHQLKGCIALGDAHKDIDVDGQLDVIHSGITVESFVELMEKKDFLLRIRKMV